MLQDQHLDVNHDNLNDTRIDDVSDEINDDRYNGLITRAIIINDYDMLGDKYRCKKSFLRIFCTLLKSQ
ncbi:hypothetical protein M8J77_019246 [Diaphorina citri]|jgi:hypothetical protein|nr:hypothetical protein M8J77_019246 [Diaphorina citri]